MAPIFSRRGKRIAIVASLVGFFALLLRPRRAVASKAEAKAFVPSTAPTNRGTPRPWAPSTAALGLLARHEAFRPRIYADSAGHATIGYGHKIHDGRPGTNSTAEAPYANGISETAAQALLREDAAKATAIVSNLVRVPLSQGQIDALTSFAFNVGRGKFAGSTLLSRLNAGAYGEVPGQLALWKYAGGSVAPGLIARREAEGRLFTA